MIKHTRTQARTRLGTLGTLALTIAATLGGTALAGSAAAAPAPAPERTWLVAAHQSNLAEIAAGKDAQQNASDDSVSALGEMLVADHTKLDKSVTALAKKYDVTLPNTPSAAQKAALASVKRNDGAAYDKAWVRTQTSGHLQTKAATQKYLSSGSAADVQAAARTATPVVQHHITELADISGDLGIAVPSAVNSGTGGQAATRGFSTGGTVLIVLGLIVISATVVFTLRRRITAPTA
jgi:putative membrane protein